MDIWLTGFLLQGCDASKCCPPSFAKNGNGQLPFNRWRLLVVTFNCSTFAHLLQIFLNNIFNQVGWQQQSNEPHWYSSAPFFCIDQLRHAWSTGLSPEEWPPFSGRVFMTQPFSRSKGEAHLIWHFCRLRLSFKWSPPPQLGRRFSRLVLHSKGSQHHLVVFKLLSWIFTALHRAVSEDLRIEAASSTPPLMRTMRRILHWWEIWWRGW